MRVAHLDENDFLPEGNGSQCQKVVSFVCTSYGQTIEFRLGVLQYEAALQPF